MASFLAPPPSSRPDSPSHFRQYELSDQSAYSGGEEEQADGAVSRIRSDVGAISMMASNEELLEARGLEGALGITEEALAFARNIAMHPETWLDFPLDEEEDLGDFDLSEAQQKHVLAIQLLAPRLAALRIELCPCHMTESYFWKVYFVLLHSRLNKHDADILSTPQVVAARVMWMQELQKQTKAKTDCFARSPLYAKDSSNILEEDFDTMPPGPFSFYPPSSSMASDFETEKHPVENTELQFVDKSVIEEKPVIKAENKDLLVEQFEDDEDDWPEEDSMGRYSGAAICVGNEDDISFSDLEDDDNCSVPIKSKVVVSRG